MLNIYLNEYDDTAQLLLEGSIRPNPGEDLKILFHTLPQEYHKVILNCAGLESISAAGLRVLMELEAEMRKKGGTLVLKNLSSAILETIQIKGLAAEFHIV